MLWRKWDSEEIHGNGDGVVLQKNKNCDLINWNHCESFCIAKRCLPRVPINSMYLLFLLGEVLNFMVTKVFRSSNIKRIYP